MQAESPDTIPHDFALTAERARLIAALGPELRSHLEYLHTDDGFVLAAVLWALKHRGADEDTIAGARWYWRALTCVARGIAIDL